MYMVNITYSWEALGNAFMFKDFSEALNFVSKSIEEETREDIGVDIPFHLSNEVSVSHPSVTLQELRWFGNAETTWTISRLFPN